MENQSIYQRLVEGNQKYIKASKMTGEISSAIRKETAQEGQHPFITIITCSDSRVIPEAIFSCGIGEVFTIRVAGNVISDEVLGSIEYATSHLHTPVVMVLGHTHCGAIHSCLHGESSGYVTSLMDSIKACIKDEKDETKALILNILGQAKTIQSKLDCHAFEVVPAIYDIESGRVRFLD